MAAAGEEFETAHTLMATGQPENAPRHTEPKEPRPRGCEEMETWDGRTPGVVREDRKERGDVGCGLRRRGGRDEGRGDVMMRLERDARAGEVGGSGDGLGRLHIVQLY